MALLPPLHQFELTHAAKPRIGFRVVACGGQEWLRNPLGSRHPQANVSFLALRNHLTWGKKPSPFVSLWDSWSRAVNWAKSRANIGAEDIHIVAVWIYDEVVYDAHQAAARFRLLPLDYHNGEVIIIGLEDYEDRNILAEFNWVTEREWKTVSFVSNGVSLSSSLPIGRLSFELDNDGAEYELREARKWQQGGFMALKEEVCSKTGSQDTSKVHALIWLLCQNRALVAALRPASQDIASDELIAQLAELGI